MQIKSHEEHCSLADSLESLLPKTYLRRTTMCVHWAKGICALDNCEFTHGEKELRKKDTVFAKQVNTGSTKEFAWATATDTYLSHQDLIEFSPKQGQLLGRETRQERRFPAYQSDTQFSSPSTSSSTVIQWLHKSWPRRRRRGVSHRQETMLSVSGHAGSSGSLYNQSLPAASVGECGESDEAKPACHWNDGTPDTFDDRGGRQKKKYGKNKIFDDCEGGQQKKHAQNKIRVDLKPE